MESGGSRYHNARLFFSGRMKPGTVLSLSPLGHSAGKGDGDVAIVPMLGKVGLGLQGFPTIAAPVYIFFSPQVSLYSSFLWLFK